MTRKYKYAKIAPQPGVQPVPDNTPSNTPYWTGMDKMRFYDGMLRKLGGWEQSNPTGAAISGVARRIFSYFYNGKYYYLIGTHTKLFEYVQGVITNITPLKTTGVTLAANPMTFVNGLTTITIADPLAGRANGDRLKISGVGGAVRGVPQAEMEKEHIISGVVASTSFVITVTTAATSGGTGGGAGVTVFSEIDDGYIDYELGFGYGGGKYGVGLYGVGKTFVNTFRKPRIWSMDRFGNDVVLTPGDGGKVYIYQNNNATAPTVLTNSPAAANFLFVENNSVCVVYNNTFYASDFGDATVWTPSATNLSYSDAIEGAEIFLAGVNIREGVLLFSTNQVWLARYVGQSSGLWSFELVDNTAGLLSPLSALSINGVAYWVGLYDFYIYDGGVARPIPNTIKQYTISTQSPSQFYKSYLRVNRAFNELWLHYPDAVSGEPSQYVIYNYIEGTFAYGTMNRTAAEHPYQADFYPVLIDSSNVLWRHEVGYNDGDNAMDAYAETNYFQLGSGDSTMRVMGIKPDSTQEGNIDFTVTTKLYPQSTTERAFGPYTIAPTSEKVDVDAHGRLVKYKFAQNAADETFIMGGWYQGLQEGTIT
jgi:hypothetical protein